MLRFLVLTTAACIVSASSAAGQTVRYVDDDAPLGGDGQSWQTARRYLYDAMYEAPDGLEITEIRVAGGLYQPDRDERGYVTPGDRTASFHLGAADLVVRGGYRGLAPGGDPNERDIDAFPSVLSGDLAGNDQPGFVNYEENSYHVVRLWADEDSVVLDGFTISGGNAVDCADKGGGGICCQLYAGPTIACCTFVGNRAHSGGGLFSRGHVGDEPFRIVDCTFVGNQATSRGGALASGGGTHVVARCVFMGNSAQSGGAVYAMRIHNLTLANSVFLGNEAAGKGGALALWQCGGDRVPVTNCLFSGNVAGTDGGAVHEGYLDDLVLTNCTISGNVAAGVGGGVYFETHGRDPRLVNCILWGNSDSNGVGEWSQFFSDQLSDRTLAYNCVQGWTGELGGIGNFGDDPLLVDADGPDGVVGTQDDDLHLLAGSPCIDAGCNWSVPRDAADLDADGDTSEITPQDLDGEGRFFDEPDSPDTGCGCPPIVDVGSYESGGTGAQPCFGDLDGSGAVDLDDLRVLLESYGQSSVCMGDLDCDGDVKLDDLANLLGAYGTVCE